jgi:hypothetical protein
MTKQKTDREIFEEIVIREWGEDTIKKVNEKNKKITTTTN